MNEETYDIKAEIDANIYTKELMDEIDAQIAQFSICESQITQ